MTLMNHPLAQAPGYASHIELELYQENGNDYQVQLIYDGVETDRFSIAQFAAMVPGAQ